MPVIIKLSDLQKSTDALFKAIFQREFGDECVLTQDMVERIVKRNLMYDFLPYIPGLDVDGFKNAMNDCREEYYKIVRTLFSTFEETWKLLLPCDSMALLMKVRDRRINKHFDEQLPAWIQIAKTFVSNAGQSNAIFHGSKVRLSKPFFVASMVTTADIGTVIQAFETIPPRYEVEFFVCGASERLMCGASDLVLVTQ